MCLIITAAAAVLATAAWYFIQFRSSGAAECSLHVGMLALMYWGAALMWSVDGIYAVMHGDPFLDVSAEDAALGALVVGCGLAVWALRLLAAQLHARRK